jgi:rubrerythrin
MYPDRKRFKIVWRDLIIAVRKARTLDELLVVIKRKYFELTGNSDPYNVKGRFSSNIQQNVNVPINSPTTVSEVAPVLEPGAVFALDSNAKYFKCAECGYEVRYYDEIMFCPNCGSSLEPDTGI